MTDASDDRVSKPIEAEIDSGFTYLSAAIAASTKKNSKQAFHPWKVSPGSFR
jgi:hypothetical protein